MPTLIDQIFHRQELQNIRRAEAAQTNLAALEGELAAAQSEVGAVETRRRALTAKVAILVDEADKAEAALALALADAEDGGPAVTDRRFAEATAHVARLRATVNGFASRFEVLRVEANNALDRQARLSIPIDRATGLAAATSAATGEVLSPDNRRAIAAGQIASEARSISVG